MKSLTIVIRNLSKHPDDEWFDCLVQQLKQVHKAETELQLKHDRHEKFSIIQIQASERIEQALSFVLAEYIINVMEPSVLLDLIKREYHIQAAPDIEGVEQYCNKFLNGSKSPLSSISVLLSQRYTYISQQVTNYFKEHSLMVVEGFVRFRLQEYVEELKALVEIAVDECMMDRQYQEFISLLQYFVYMQESKIPSAHLIHKGGHEFLILDDKLEAIDTKECDATFRLEVLEKDINFEDVIVSTLLTVAPATIHIHTREPDVLIIKTIMQIFEGRTTLCPYCRNCHAYLGELSKKDQLSP